MDQKGHPLKKCVVSTERKGSDCSCPWFENAAWKTDYFTSLWTKAYQCSYFSAAPTTDSECQVPGGTGRSVYVKDTRELFRKDDSKGPFPSAFACGPKISSNFIKNQAETLI